MKHTYSFTRAALVLGALTLLGLTFPVAAGNITVKGSDTMVILGQKWAEVYMSRPPA
jgi:phosphate transport system substrate-binding protein